MSRATPDRQASTSRISAALFGPGDFDRFEFGAFEAKIGGRPDVFLQLAVADFGDEGLAGQGDFAEAVGAVHDGGAARAEPREHGGQQRPQFVATDAEQLIRRPGRIGERAEQVEDRAARRASAAPAPRASSRRA